MRLISPIIAPFKKISAGDVVFVGGLLLMGYGLWLLRPWISFTVVGVLLMWTAIGLMRSERG